LPALFEEVPQIDFEGVRLLKALGFVSGAFGFTGLLNDLELPKAPELPQELALGAFIGFGAELLDFEEVPQEEPLEAALGAEGLELQEELLLKPLLLLLDEENDEDERPLEEPVFASINC
jgi:hypothetical protein